MVVCVYVCVSVYVCASVYICWGEGSEEEEKAMGGEHALRKPPRIFDIQNDVFTRI